MDTGNSTSDNNVWAVILANKDNITALHEITVPHWVSASNFRGTVNILQSCVLTIVACVYTALHLNIPDETSWSSQLQQKSKWVVLTLMAPEIVVAAAATQFFQALDLKRTLQHLQQKTTELKVKEYQFSITYAFFVVMGGLRIPARDLASVISVNDAVGVYGRKLHDLVHAQSPAPSTLVLTPHGVLKFAENNMWVLIPEQTIADRSKANTIQKALVLLQVSWMFIQCVARAAYGLPITLLELHTMVHVVCAFLMYGFWFKKPLDVIVHEARFETRWLPTLAVMLQADFYWGKIDHHRHGSERVDYEIRRDGEPDFVECSPTMKPPAWSLVDIRRQNQLEHHPTLQVPSALVAEDFGDEETFSAQSLRNVPPQRPLGLRGDGSGDEQVASQCNPRIGQALVPGLRCRDPAVFLRDLEEGGVARACARWTLVAAEMERHAPDARTTSFYDFVCKQHRGGLSFKSQGVMPYPKGADMVPGRAPGFRAALDPILPMDASTRFRHLFLDTHSVREFLETFRDVIAKFYNAVGAILLFFILPAAYGGVHLGAWGFEFPTQGEMWAWRMSSLWIAGFVVYLLMIGLWNSLIGLIFVLVRRALGPRKLEDTIKCLAGILYNLYFILVGLLVLVSLLARLFLVVESLASLRLVPVGVYWTPAWLEMIPHA